MDVGDTVSSALVGAPTTVTVNEQIDPTYGHSLVGDDENRAREKAFVPFIYRKPLHAVSTRVMEMKQTLCDDFVDNKAGPGYGTSHPFGSLFES